MRPLSYVWTNGAGAATAFFSSHFPAEGVASKARARWQLWRPWLALAAASGAAILLEGCGGGSEESLPRSQDEVILQGPTATLRDLTSLVAAASAGEDMPDCCRRFTVVLNSETDDGVGAELVDEFNSLYIASFDEDGLFGDWNGAHDVEAAVLPGDRIVEVNGIRGHAEHLLDALVGRRRLEMTILRIPKPMISEPAPAHRYEVMLDRSQAQHLGIKCSQSADSLLVESILGQGLAAEWNKNAEESDNMAIHIGDRITAVNGVEGDGVALVIALETLIVLEIRLVRGDLLRPPPPKETPTTTTEISDDPDPFMPVTTTTTTLTTTLPQTPRMKDHFVQGLKAEFFYDIDRIASERPITPAKLAPVFAKKPDLVRIEPQIYFPLSMYGWPGISAMTEFAARFTGELMVVNTGVYTFSLTSDDGSTLSVDGSNVVGEGSFNEHVWGSEPVHDRLLERGEHQVEIRYFNTVLHAGLILKYKGPDTHNEWVSIPPSAFRCSVNSLPDELVGGTRFERKFLASDGIVSFHQLTAIALPGALTLALLGLLIAWSVKSGRRQHHPSLSSSSELARGSSGVPLWRELLPTSSSSLREQRIQSFVVPDSTGDDAPMIPSARATRFLVSSIDGDDDEDDE
mmetsp:Transcript_90520/g.198321  ORF Transcript_90520/g.198321 Transcript_90520/m.198321 type:complete len:631 (-) Transcript_90520:109-2001(-)